MRDVARLKEQDKKRQEEETVGNEYPDHKAQKERIHKLLESKDWLCQYEKKVHCKNPHTGELNKYPYSLDVFAFQYINGIYHKIGVEINREETGGGHGSKITGPKDRNRAQDIEEQYGIKVIQFNVSHLKSARGETVLQEIYQHLGIRHDHN